MSRALTFASTVATQLRKLSRYNFDISPMVLLVAFSDWFTRDYRGLSKTSGI